MGVKAGVFKKYQTKPPEDERTEIYLKGLLQEILEIQNLVKQESIDMIGSLLQEYRTLPSLAKLLDSLNKK
mgnify:CR=1 FL=1